MEKIKENKIWTGMKPLTRKTLYKGSMSYLREQCEKVVPKALSEQTSTHQHLEK